MIWFIYNILFVIGFLLMLPRFLIRMWRRGGYRKDFLQRAGIYSPDVLKRLSAKKRIWVHAVSVGEVYVALRFMRELRPDNRDIAFILTTNTSTGYKIAEAGLNDDDVLLYFPLDFSCVVNRVLGKLNPAALILTECELWPNLIRLAKNRNIPIILINGRISESSYKGYKLLRFCFSKVLECMDLFLVQTDTDKQRLLDIGASRTKIHVVGSAKYDITGADGSNRDHVFDILEATGISRSDNIMVGGSTWPGEEDALLAIYKRLRTSFKDLRLVLVPRHAERAGDVEKDIARHGLTCVRRSKIEQSSAGEFAHTGDNNVVLLVDTTGELMDFYSAAAVIFVGKSLKAHGGQNIIEPAILGKPVIVGPYMENFPVVISDFLTANAVIQVQDEEELEENLRSLLADEKLCKDYGLRAQALAKEKQGVVQNSVELMRKVI
ncbi:3-deoxy-D-manno-octulosonic acid transferase [Verrucomicrobiota bacterium]